MIIPLHALAKDEVPDICIIGAGAAGITLACELEGTGLRVLLLDAGKGRHWGRTSQDPYVGRASLGHPPPEHFRRRGFGGTTRIWGGRCVPLDPIDFQKRDFVPDSGWPIKYDEVAPYFPPAMSYCDAGEFDFNSTATAVRPRPTLPGFDGDDLIDAGKIERYSLPTDFGRRYAERLGTSRNITVVTEAHCRRLVRSNETGRIEQLELMSKSGAPFMLRAGYFVVAVGGLETPRLLFASDLAGSGLGNQSDNLGRYYMCHLETVLGTVRTGDEPAVFNFERTHDGVYARRKFQIRPEAQLEHGLLNAAFRLHYPNIADPAHRSPVLSATFLAKQALIPEYRRILEHGAERRLTPNSAAAHVRNMAKRPHELAHFAYTWTHSRILASRKLPHMLATNADGSYCLDFNTEQVPCRNSRVRLGEDRDTFGVPRLVVEWQASAADRQSICRTYRLMHRSLRHEGATLDLDLDGLEQAAANAGPVGGHHIGTARMAATDRSGVVDRNCGVFGCANLFVASAAVFPTSGHANPTLTLVALTLRLADHLGRLALRQS